ncbi:Quinone oxidoreductase 2 [Bacillus licheniformis]|nr:Quinone oxidoreductase 2 [Bacillus licheniformis]
MKMLVTGATGKLGSKIVEKLLETVPADQLAVSVRNPEKAEALRARGVMCATGILTARKHWNPHFEALTVC